MIFLSRIYVRLYTRFFLYYLKAGLYYDLEMKPAHFFALLIFLFLAGCTLFADLFPSTRLIPTGTPTSTPTIPPTRTLVPTQTPTTTLTPTVTLTPTQTETPAPLAPASLFSFHDANGRTIDWSYAHASYYVKSENGSPKVLFGFMAFQLIDRAIHHQTITYDGQTLTVYYLNVQHEFSGQMQPVKLILSAASGQDVPIALIPAGGGTYVRMRLVARWDIFDASSYHRDANKAYADRSRRYPDVLLPDLEKLLPTLPDGLITLADAPDQFLTRTRWDTRSKIRSIRCLTWQRDICPSSLWMNTTALLVPVLTPARYPACLSISSPSRKEFRITAATPWCLSSIQVRSWHCRRTRPICMSVLVAESPKHFIDTLYDPVC